MTDMTMQDAVLLGNKPRRAPAKARAVVQPMTEEVVLQRIRRTEIKLVLYSLIKFVLICLFLAAGWDIAATIRGFPTFYMTLPMAVLSALMSSLIFAGFQFITSKLETQLEDYENALDKL